MLVFKTSSFDIKNITDFELNHYRHFPIIVRRVNGLGEDILVNQMIRQKFWYEMNVIPADWNKIHILEQLEKQFKERVGIKFMSKGDVK